jgi:ubiquinone/menaquinone biosynthesis C-methylase UbiE
MATKHHEKDIERFDHWSGTYESSWMQRVFFDPVHQKTLALAAEIVPQPADVLDIGCGTGKLLRRVHSYWPQARLIGVDPADGMIEMAKRLTPNATFYKGMAEELPLQDRYLEIRNQVGESEATGLVKVGSRLSRGAAPSTSRSSSKEKTP